MTQHVTDRGKGPPRTGTCSCDISPSYSRRSNDLTTRFRIDNRYQPQQPYRRRIPLRLTAWSGLTDMSIRAGSAGSAGRPRRARTASRRSPGRFG